MSRCTSPESWAAPSARTTCRARVAARGRIERTFVDQGIAQRPPARDVFHLDEMMAVRAPQVVDRHDVGMQQVRRRAGLGPELLANPRLPRVAASSP